MIAIPLMVAALSNVSFSCLNHVVEKYLKEKNLLVVGEDPPVEELTCVGKKAFVLYCGNQDWVFHQQPYDVISHGVRNASQLSLTLKSLGNVRGRIVVTVEDSESLAWRILSLLWNSNRITDVIVLVGTGSSVDVFTWFPYMPDECNEVKTITLLDSWRNGSFVNGRDLFPPKITRNLHGCVLRMSTRYIEPYVFPPVNGVFRSGYEVMIIREFQKTFNFSVNFVPPPDFANFWSIDSPTGVFTLLREQKIDLAFGSMMVRHDRYEKSEALYPHTIETFVWTYPKPGYKTNFYSIYIVFSPELWALILLFHVLAAVAFFVLYNRSNQRVGFGTCFFNCIAILCNNAYFPQPKGAASRFVAVLYVVYALHLYAAYQSYLIFLLTNPERLKPVRDFSELVNQGMKAYLFKTGSVMYNKSDHRTWNKVLLPTGHHFIDGEDLAIFLHDIAVNKSSILFFSKSSTDFITNLMYPDGGKSIFSQLPYYTCPLTMYLSRGNPLQGIFNERLQALIDTGIFPQWKKLILFDQAEIAQRTYKLSLSPKDTQPLSMKHLEGTFLMWFSLLTFSTLTFLSEILWNQISKHYRKINHK
ncbi:UNVERIFIED_CONTAM: hypothetical protein PYX00_002992 [Menopon gallinae]|uniref:Ionotropic receptor n=1 Tax=Menopon gallinae TaxID=328185 RepID=A0AAW2HZY0_9NEOP